jgi:hypothetical protein
MSGSSKTLRHFEKLTRSTCGALVLSLGACAAQSGLERTAPTIAPSAEAAPKTEVLQEQEARSQAGRTVSLPGLAMNLDNRELQLDGRVCIERGVLEYVAVAAGGKEYESIFSLRCRPSHVNVALLLAGYQAGDLAPDLRGDYSPNADPAANQPPEGAPQGTDPPKQYWAKPTAEPTRVTVDVDVRRRDGTWERRPIEEFLLDRRTEKSPDRLVWAFTGSFFYRDEGTGLEVFVADVERSLIALWYDPSALLNLGRDVGNPYRGEAAGLEVNPATLPDRDTPVRIILRPVSTPKR